MSIINALPWSSKSTLFPKTFDSRSGCCKHFPFSQAAQYMTCQWRVLEEYWRKNGILCLESALLFLLVWGTVRGHLPYQQTGVFFVCLFDFLPESIGSDGKQVVDALCEFQWYPSRQVPGDLILVHQLWHEAPQWTSPYYRSQQYLLHQGLDHSQSQEAGSGEKAKCFPSWDALPKPQKWWLYPAPLTSVFWWVLFNFLKLISFTNNSLY